jgi:hypothetical protein
MTTSRIQTVMVPPLVSAPRGAEIAADISVSLARAARAAWHGLEQVGRQRAARELRQMAQRWRDIDPKLARAMQQASLFDFDREHNPGGRV